MPASAAHCKPRDGFASLIPSRPYCVDEVGDRLLVRDRERALQHRHVQLNGPTVLQWMAHDVDRCDAYLAHRDAFIPEPTFIAINRQNGHAHCAILLAAPVTRVPFATRDAPLRFYSAVERGIARRIGADRAYVGLIAKNPLHPAWDVEWRRDEPYSLEELADWLRFEDMRPDLSVKTTFGAGRNVTVFDELRQIAYREVLPFKRSGSMATWLDRCLRVATGLNQQFPTPLDYSEVRAVVRSVAKWTWRNFTEQTFSKRQAHRSKLGHAKRSGNASERQAKPWLTLGISERTYRRRKQASRMTCNHRSSATGDSGSMPISDNSPSGGSSFLAIPRLIGVKLPLDRWPHLRRLDGFGRVDISGRWAAKMRAFVAARRSVALAAA
jgi:Replicase family/Primase C terminal 1 (PriCT-1)